MKTPVLGHLTPFAKILFLVILLITGLFLALLTGILLAIPIYHLNLMTDLSQLSDFSDPVTVSLMKYLQVVQSLGLFIFPPLVAGYLFERKTFGYSGMTRVAGFQVFLLVILFMFFSIPFINGLVTLNERMQLPSFLSGIEEWMKNAEDEAAQLTDAFLDVHSFGGFLVNLFVIAALPALGEELLFRGVIQKLLGQWFRNIPVAIFVTALIFGIIHMQFYGLLPRVMLGLIFGYLYHWTKSLWVPVFAHFLNNGAVVVLSYLASIKLIGPGYEDFGNTNNFLLIAGSALASAAILWLIRKKQPQTTPVPSENNPADADSGA